MAQLERVIYALALGIGIALFVGGNAAGNGLAVFLGGFFIVLSGLRMQNPIHPDNRRK